MLYTCYRNLIILSIYSCSMVFCLNCIDSMIVCDFLFLVMLIFYSWKTHIKLYFIRNTLLIVPFNSSATYSLCCMLKSSNLITLESLSLIHSLCYEPTSNNWITDVSVTIKRLLTASYGCT